MNKEVKISNHYMIKSVQPQKKSHTSSEYQSLLVSSVRYDPSQSNTRSQQPRIMSKPSHGSLIKRNIPNNIYVEDINRCNCEHKYEQLSSAVKMLTLTVQEIQTKINICFTKQASLQSSLSDNVCKMEEKEHRLWEVDLKVTEEKERNVKSSEEIKFQIKQICQEINRIKKNLSRVENKESDKCLSSKLVEHKLQKYKGEQDIQFSNIFDAIQEIGNLQHKMIAQSNRQTSTFPDQQCIYPITASRVPQKQIKILKGCSLMRNRTCESTNISYSRNMSNSK